MYGFRVLGVFNWFYPNTLIAWVLLHWQPGLEVLGRRAGVHAEPLNSSETVAHVCAHEQRAHQRGRRSAR